MNLESDRRARAPRELPHIANANYRSLKRRFVTYGLAAFAGGFVATLVAGSVLSLIPASGFGSALLSVVVLSSVAGLGCVRQTEPDQPPVNQYTNNNFGGDDELVTFDDADIITHELESSIFAIQRMVTVGEFSNPTETQAKVLKGIRSESEHLRTLVEDLQAISDLNRSVFEIQPRVIELSSLLEPAIHTFQAVGQHNVELDIQHRTSVYVDPDRINQVIRNLLFNAVKYSPRNTTIRVRASAKGGRTLIEVADEGLGISPEDRDRIFKPYDRGGDLRKKPIDGVGLGLYISQCIARLHGSRINVSSTPGGGSVFSFSLESVNDPDTYRR